MVAVAEVRELAANARCKDGARAKGLAQRAHAAAPESACAIEARVCQQEFDQILSRSLSRALRGIIGERVRSRPEVGDRFGVLDARRSGVEGARVASR